MNPLKQAMNVRREELPQALAMSSYFFLVIATFWVLRPLKTGLFVQYYDQTGLQVGGWLLDAAQAQMIAKVGNMVVAFLAAAVFIRLSRTLEREKLTYVFSVFSILCLLAFGVVIGDPGQATVWNFYWFGDLYNTLMVAAFFAFLNDSVTPSAAKRLYGLIVLGGVAGGAFGSIILAGWIGQLSMRAWLGIAAFNMVLVMAVAAIAGRRFGAPPAPPDELPSKATPASAFRMVSGSRYLLAIVAIVGLYEMVSTMMDFQFTSTIAYYLDGEAITRQFATVFAITNSTALLVQLFLTSFIMTRFGVGVALLFLPVAALAGSAAFMAFPLLWVGSLLNTADSGLNYSINQSAKEALYTPRSRAEKYQAKAFIDMFVMRFAKALAVGLSLAITLTFTGFENVRWLSLATIAILFLWIRIARFAGTEFHRATETSEVLPRGRAVAHEGEVARAELA